MLVRQSKNSFIRCTDKYGYINDQLTRQDRVYDEIGALFLKQINRTPKDIDTIIASLLQEFEEVPIDELKRDFLEFVDSLEKGRFIVTGETPEELDQKDLSFTYMIDNPYTLIEDYTQQTKECVSENTQDFFLEEVQGRPVISALQFELSSRCNERCIHCYIPNGKKDAGHDMSTDKVKSIIDEFSEMGGLHVTLSGGEAFLHKDLLEICRYCRERKILKYQSCLI